MKKALRTLLLGLVAGLIIGFPLGINFGRGVPLLSNPLEQKDLKSRVTESVKEKTGELMEGAKESIHKATRPEKKEP